MKDGEPASQPSREEHPERRTQSREGGGVANAELKKENLQHSRPERSIRSREGRGLVNAE